jgi:ureidoglycolate lyase
MVELVARPLTAEAFAPYGEVIDLRTAKTMPINTGLTTRFHDLVSVDVAAEGGKSLVNVFRSRPLPLPHRVRIMERHPLGSQAFIPMQETRFLVLVGRGEQALDESSLELFVTDGRQGVNFFRNTWHHFQITLGAEADYLVVDRGGPGNNLEEVEVAGEFVIPA